MAEEAGALGLSRRSVLLLRSGHGGIGAVLLGSWGSSRDGRAGGSTRGGTAGGSVARHGYDGVVV